jgi:hypothetical protein
MWLSFPGSYQIEPPKRRLVKELQHNSGNEEGIRAYQVCLTLKRSFIMFLINKRFGEIFYSFFLEKTLK